MFANAISPPGDIDYFSFGAIAGNEYTITTSNLAGVDTIMDLVDAGFLGVAFNADAVPGFPESQIIYTATLTETLYIQVSDQSGSGTGTYDLTVTFAAGAALPQLSVDSQPVTEGAPFVTFTVTADATSASTISVDVMTMDGTAVYPSDYTMFSTTVMIPPGEMTATFDVTIVDDATPEPEETFDVVLSNPVNATILTGTGTATITDDDAVSPQLSVDSPPINEFNTEVTFTVALDVVSASDVTFDVSTVDGTATAAGGDYTSLVDTITITAGSSLASIPVSILDDAVNEVNETFDLVLSMPVNATILTGTGTATIIDDDPSSILVDDATAVEGDGFLTFTVSLTTQSEQEVSASYTTVGDFATADVDYMTSTGTAIIAAGSLTTTIDVPLIDDSEVESDETFSILLSNPTGNGVTLADDTGIGTITDDDVTPQLSIDSQTIGEGDGFVTFTVTADVVNTVGMSVDYATGDGTAIDGQDYTAAFGTVTIMAGMTFATFDVAILDDAVEEADETFGVFLAMPVNAIILSGEGTGTIVDDDAVLPVVSIDSPTVGEIGVIEGLIIFSVSLDAVSGVNVSVDVTTSDGTAIAGEDYNATNETVTIIAGETSVDYIAFTVDDGVQESDETFTATLSNPVNATLGDAIGTATIIDDDAPLPQLSVDSPTASEGDEDMVFTITLDAVSGVNVDFTITTSGLSAIAGEDYFEVEGDAWSIPAGSTSTTFAIGLVDDAVTESEETFELFLADAVNATILNGTGTATITDNDVAIPADAFEPNNDYTTATPIPTDGTVYANTLHSISDEDWFSIPVVAGVTYTVTTSNVFGPALIYIEAYGSSGTAFLGGADSTFFYTAVETGTQFILVYDDDSLTGSYDVAVTADTEPVVADEFEPNEIFVASASIATDGTVYANTFHVSGDMDWFKISVVAGATYTITTSNLAGTTDTYMELYDSFGSGLLASNDNYVPGPESQIVYTAVESGTHFILITEVEDGFGSYDLDVVDDVEPPAADEFEPNNDVLDSRSIVSDGTVNANTFHVSGDMDWFNISMVAGATYTITTFNLAESTDTYLELYGLFASALLASNDNYLPGEDHASQIVYTAVENVTHFIVITDGSGGVGSYDFDVTDDIEPLAADAFEPNDLYTTATPILTDGTAYSNTFYPAGDDDWFSIPVTLGATYTITTFNLAGSTDTELYLYDAAGAAAGVGHLVYNDDYLSDGEGPGPANPDMYASQIIYTATEDGAYFILAQELGTQVGSYDINVTEAAAPILADVYEPNDTFGTATAIIPAGTICENTFHTISDADWFSFEASLGTQYTITTSNLSASADTIMVLYDSSGTSEIAQNDDNIDVDSQIVFIAGAAATYYVEVTDLHGAIGTYDFDVLQGEPPTVPTLSIGDVSVVEGDDSLTPVIVTLSVELSEAFALDVSFDVEAADGTATIADGDYDAITQPHYIIAAGETSIGIDITVNSDEIAESAETFTVNITNVVNANPGTTTATITIENDDLLDIIIEADIDGDGGIEASEPPYPVYEFNDPNSVLNFVVSGGVGPDYTLTVVSIPSLGVLINPEFGTEVVAGDMLTVTGGMLALEFAGTAQNSSSAEPSDAFIISVIDNGDVELTSGSVIVELNIMDVNQTVVVAREGLTYVASGSVANIPLVDFTDVDMDGIPDPSIYDLDGDNLVFANAVSALGAEVWVSGSSVRYTAPIFNDVASGGDPLTDTITVDVTDDSGLGAEPVQAHISVKIQPVVEITLSVAAWDGGFYRDLRLGVGPEGIIDTSATTTGSIVDMTAEQSPPEAPGSSARAWITGASFLLRDIQEISSEPFPRTWTIHARTGSSGGSSLDWHGPDVNHLASQLEIYTGVTHSATIANIATGETWELTGDIGGSITLDDNQSYNFEVAFTPSAGGDFVSGELMTGWNLASIPGVGDLGSLDALSNSAFVWDGSYVGVGFLTHDEVPAVTTGVFINSNGGFYDLELDVDSPDIRDVTASLIAGWNLIGAPSNIDSASYFPVSNLAAQLGHPTSVFGFDTSKQSYDVASELVPGNGYWVYNDNGVTVDVQLTQPRHLAADGSSLFHPRAVDVAPSAAPPTIDWSLPLSLGVEDGTFRTVSLGLSTDATVGYDRLDIAMPPTPPIRNYSHLYVDVEDAVGRLSRSVQSMQRSGTEWTMSARVDGGSGLVEWQRPNVPEHWRLTMETGGNVVDMVERQSVRLGNGTHELRVMLTWIAPVTTRLMPNYPNPFNPETWIPFELTQAADVTVRIYGQDGSIVRTLDLGRRAEGYHTGVADAAYWDGRNESGETVASGVYVYELQPGTYRAMRRMVIMK